MKRIYVCIGILVVLVALTAISEIYVANTVKQTTLLLSNAIESSGAGDDTAAREYADSAWKQWRSLTQKSGYVLADLSIVAEVTVSLSRVSTLAYSDNSDRFLEECAATIVMLEHFLADNQDTR